METIQTKECSICGIDKPITEFYKHNQKSKDGSIKVYHNPECKECTKERAKKWKSENHEKVLESARKTAAKPERKQKVKEYRKTIKERRYETLKTWQENNRDKTIEYNRKRNENKTHDINSKEWNACKQYFNYECAYCGINETEAKEIQGQYFHKEHVEHNGENDLSNCIPSCRSCNSSKWVWSLEDWYNESNEHFTYERLEKINKWLDGDYKKFIKKS